MIVPVPAISNAMSLEHLHVDKINDSPSYIIALGEYQGDRL